MQLILNNEGSGELYLQIMKAICGDTSDKTLLDIMCHHAPFTPLLGFKERTYVDIQNRPLDNYMEQKFFIKSDVIDFLERGYHYDTIICSDGIEHLPLQKGRLLINLMERYSDMQIIFTPLGDYMTTIETHPDQHQSGWLPDYFEGWAGIVMPNFHPLLNIGAFFCWHCKDIKNEFNRVKKELSWIK